VQRDDACLRPEPGQGQHEERSARRAVEAARGAADRRKVEGLRAFAEGEEHHQQRRGPGVRHDQVEEAGARVLLAPVADHQAVAGERHALPGEEEGDGVPGAAHEGHARHEGQERHGLEDGRLRVRAQVGRTVQGGGGGDERDDEEEERREPVHREGHGREREQPREREVQRGCGSSREHSQRDGGSHHGADQDQQVSRPDHEARQRPHLPGAGIVLLSGAESRRGRDRPE
jgi:hypothetical protein